MSKISKDQVIDAIAEIITLEEEDYLETRDGYKELYQKKKQENINLPTANVITKVFGSYTKFKQEIGKGDGVEVKNNSKPSLKDFLKNRNK